MDFLISALRIPGFHFAFGLIDLRQQSGDCDRESSPEMEHDSAAGVWSRWGQHLDGWAEGPVQKSI